MMPRGLSAALSLPGSGVSASGVSFADADDHAPEADGLSSRRIFRGGVNVSAIRRSFPGLWAEYLRANFPSACAVHKAFPGVDEKTCRDWWNGKRDPSGCFVAAVIKRDTRAIDILGRIA